MCQVILTIYLFPAFCNRSEMAHKKRVASRNAQTGTLYGRLYNDTPT